MSKSAYPSPLISPPILTAVPNLELGGPRNEMAGNPANVTFKNCEDPKIK
jgi:hypothetical protein